LLLLDLEALLRAYKLTIESVIHVGAHTGQEAETYARLGIGTVTWIEANPDVIPRLREHVEPFGHDVVCAVLSDRRGEPIEFKVTNNEQSSSLLAFGTHRYEHPEVKVTGSLSLITTTLDDLYDEGRVPTARLLLLDVQGAELLVLKGAQRLLEQAECVYAEVNERPLYDGAVLLPELDAFLRERGFERVETALTIHGWGEAFYLRPGASTSNDQWRDERESTPPARRRFSPKHMIGLQVYAVVSGAVGPRFDAVTAEIDELHHRITIIEQMLVRNEREIGAVHKQLEACLDLLQAIE
jgi:FkbM family methyltransferase